MSNTLFRPYLSHSLPSYHWLFEPKYNFFTIAKLNLILLEFTHYSENLLCPLLYHMIYSQSFQDMLPQNVKIPVEEILKRS